MSNQSASCCLPGHPSDDKSDGEIPEQAGDSSYVVPNSSAPDASRTTESVALLQSRLEDASGAPVDEDVTMGRTCSQAANAPHTSRPPSARANSPELRPVNAPGANMDVDNVDGSIAVTVPCEGGKAKTFLPPVDFDNLDTTARHEVALRTLALAPWWWKDGVCADDHSGFNAYADPQGYFPGLIHVDALNSWMWQRAFCVRDRDLCVVSGGRAPCI